MFSRKTESDIPYYRMQLIVPIVSITELLPASRNSHDASVIKSKENMFITIVRILSLFQMF